MRKKIDLKRGTAVSFEGDSQVYEIACQELLGPCPEDCDQDHDCYEEAYVSVTRWTGTALPLSKLNLVFDPVTHVGEKYDRGE